MSPEAGIEVSAPSKIILHGEHGVVYGKMAVAGSLDLRTRMRILKITDKLIVHFPDIGVHHQTWSMKDLKPLFTQDHKLEDIILQLLPDPKNPIQVASLTCFFYLYKRILNEFKGLKISVKSDIPMGAGLGSSAALSVCLAAGLLSINEHKNATDPDVISKYALLSEKILHGSPSGIDSSVSSYGGLISFKNGVIQRLNSPFDIKVLLVESGIQRNTKKIVGNVRERLLSYPKVIEPLLDGINDVSEEFLKVIQNMDEDTEPLSSDFEALEELIAKNHSLLRTLGVSHPRLEDIVRIANSMKFRGVKLTGAGGGGFAYIFIPPTTSSYMVDKLISLIEKRGFERPRLTSIGVSGVQIKVLEDNN